MRYSFYRVLLLAMALAVEVPRQFGRTYEWGEDHVQEQGAISLPQRWQSL